MKKAFRIISLTSAVMVVLMLVLSGCSTKNTGSVTTPGSETNPVSTTEAGKTSGEKVTLSVMYTSGSPEEQKGEREIYDAFTVLHPNIKVNLILSPYEQEMDKLLTMAAGGNVPDLIWIPESGGPPLLEKGVIRDLNEMLDKSGINREDWLPTALAYGMYQGKLYGLPRDIVTWTIAYNKDLFDKAKVPYPKAGWTMNDFLDTAKKLTITDKNGKITQYGTNPYYWDQALIANGVHAFNRDGSEVLLDKPEAIDAFQWVADLSNVEKVTLSPTEASASGNMFLSGKAAMAFTGPWEWNSFKKEGLNWDIVETPGGKAGNKSSLLGQPIAMSANTKHPNEAWQLLEFITHGGGQDIQTAKVGAHPSIRGKADAYSKLPAAPASISVLENSMEKNTVVTPDFTKYPEAMTLVNPVIDQIMMGKVKAKDVFPDLAKKLREKFGMK